MLTTEIKLVNPWATKAMLFLLLFSASACGFQLNQNQLSLPNNANSLSLKVTNSTYIPSLDLELQRELSRHFSANNIKLSPASRADLSLNINLIGSSSLRQDFSVYNSQTFRFQFSHQISLSLQDNRTKKWIFQGTRLSGSYPLDTTATELNTEELRIGQQRAMLDLAQKISEKLTQNF